MQLLQTCSLIRHSHAIIQCHQRYNFKTQPRSSKIQRKVSSQDRQNLAALVEQAVRQGVFAKAERGGGVLDRPVTLPGFDKK